MTSSQIRRLLPWLWLGLSVVWGVVILLTGEVVWPLVLWVATTLGPLTYLRRRNRLQDTDET